MSSLNKKYCPECHTYIPWYLEQGQKSPLTSHIGGLVDSPIQVNTTTASSENHMLPTEFFIPLHHTTEQEIADFCDLFASVNNLQQIPDEFIVLAFEASKERDQGIFVSTDPASTLLAIGILKDDADLPLLDISQVSLILVLQSFMSPKPTTEEPVNTVVEDTAANDVSNSNRLTVKEAANEYVEVYREIIGIARQLGIPAVSMVRIENVKHILNELAQSYLKSLTDH